MDIKLDFVPPSLINFISRQLIGNGHKLYQKAVGSVATTDEDYREALKGQIYVRTREGVVPFCKFNAASEGLKDEEKSTAFLSDEPKGRKSPANMPAMDNPQDSEIEVEKEAAVEVEADEEQQHDLYLESNRVTSDIQTSVTVGHKHHNKISPEVEHALNVLDEAIAIFRDLGSPEGNQIQAPWKAEETVSLNGRDEPRSYATVKSHSEEMGSLVIEKSRDGGTNPIERRSGNCDQRIPFSSPNRSIGSDEDKPRTSLDEGQHGANTTRSRPMTPSHEGPMDDNMTRSQLPSLDHMSKVFDEVSAEVNGARGSGRYEALHVKKKKQHRFCCLSFN